MKTRTMASCENPLPSMRSTFEGSEVERDATTEEESMTAEERAAARACAEEPSVTSEQGPR